MTTLWDLRLQKSAIAQKWLTESKGKPQEDDRLQRTSDVPGSIPRSLPHVIKCAKTLEHSTKNHDVKVTVMTYLTVYHILGQVSKGNQGERRVVSI